MSVIDKAKANIISAAEGNISNMSDQQCIVAAMSKTEWMELEDICSKSGLQVRAFDMAFWHLRIYEVVTSKALVRTGNGAKQLWRLKVS